VNIILLVLFLKLFEPFKHVRVYTAYMYRVAQKSKPLPNDQKIVLSY